MKLIGKKKSKKGVTMNLTDFLSVGNSKYFNPFINKN